MGCQYKRAYDNREVKLVIASESARAVLFKFCTNNLVAYKSPAGKHSYRQDFYIWPGYRDSLSFEDEMLKKHRKSLFQYIDFENVNNLLTFVDIIYVSF